MYGEIRNKFYEGTVGATGLNNRMYYVQAPQNIGETPYSVFYLINQNTSRGDSNSTRELFWVQFNVFCQEKAAAKTVENVSEAIIEKLEALKHTISVSGYKILDYKRDFVLPAQKIDGFWRLSLQYSLLLDK